MKLPSLSSPLIGREHHLARPFCAGNVTLFCLHWDERNLEMEFSLSIGYYFNITNSTCAAGNWKINLEARIGHIKFSVWFHTVDSMYVLARNNML